MFDYVEYSYISENQKYTDTNNVFIPFRPVFEMELVISLYLVHSNLNEIALNPALLSNKKDFQNVLNLEENSLAKDMIDRFYIIIEKLRPISSRTRKTYSFRRIGNVNAYTKSRIPAFFALDHLKFKILLLRNFLKALKINNFDLTIFPKYIESREKTLEAILFQEYFSRSIEYFKLISPKKEFIGRRKHKTLHGVDTESLEPMWSYICKTSYNPEMNYILRGIKSNLFVINTIFAYMDVPNPFEYKDGHVLEVFKSLTNPDFIPKLIPSMSEALITRNFTQLEDLYQAFEFFMVRILEGIKNAVKISSNNLINLEENQTIYYTGNLLNF